jgi:hypothetical protein
MNAVLLLTGTVTVLSLSGSLAAQTRVATASATTSKAWMAPRTPWGDPDLQAAWSTEDLRDVPLTTQRGYQIFPYECHEGNLMVIQVLSGARAEERTEAEAVKRGLPVPPRVPIWTAPEGVQVPR